MKAGAKITYNPDNLENILHWVKEAGGSLGQVADKCGFPRNTFYDWLKAGDLDREQGNQTYLAQLSGSVREAQATVVIDFLKLALKAGKNSKFIQWWLSIVFKADFGTDAALINELVEKLTKLEQDFKRYIEQPLQHLQGTQNGKADNSTTE